jgi:two-component system sensor histidine kinase/response regulator
MDDYVTKPIRTGELIAAIQTTNRRDGSRSAGQLEPLPVSSTAIDREALTRLAASVGDEDPSFMAELLDEFAAEAPAMIAALGDAVRGGNAKDAHRIAHTLKSNAATFGAMPLSEVARDLEAQAKEGSLEGADVLVTQLSGEYERVSTEFEKIRGELTSS